MSIAPLEGPPRTRRILTYDLEWHPSTDEDPAKRLQLRCATLYDGAEFYTFHTIEDFLNECLQSKHAGAWFFAHYGGRFDFNFLLPAIVKSNYKTELYFSGSSVVRAEITVGRRVWSFCDSQFFFDIPLRLLGEAVGLEKIDCPFDAPLKQLEEYNRRDCEILHRAIEWLQDVVLELGGELRRTIASTALGLFRRSFQTDILSTSPVLNRQIESGYVGGRVEVFKNRLEWGYEHDRNSSYPHSMAMGPLPGMLLRTNFDWKDSNQCVAHVRVKVPDCHVAPLPYRHNGTLMFPTGEFEGWYHTADLQLLEECGGRVLSTHEAHHFGNCNDFAEYVHSIYEKRKLAKKQKQKFRSYALKKLLNCLYGKFGEKTTREVIVVNPRSRHCPHNGAHIVIDAKGNKVSTCVRELRPGIIAITEETEVPHEHIPIVMGVTARSRAAWWRYARKLYNLAYGDTDSTYSQTDSPNSDELGGWERVCEFKNGVFVAPKGFKYFALDGEKPNDWTVKFKGFPRLTSEGFDRLIAGEGCPTRRMGGVKTSIRKGDLVEETSIKYLSRACEICGRSPKKRGSMVCAEHGATVVTRAPGFPKRVWDNGESRPWSVFGSAYGSDGQDRIS